jgi:tripartite-type tricarboxylate transporter receptor subunit TctC
LGEIFSLVASIKINQVPFQGYSEALAMILGKHVQLIFAYPTSIREYVKVGQLRVLAVSGEKRMTDPTFNNVPTFKEQSFDVVFEAWSGIVTPKPLPDNTKGELALEISRTANDPEFRADMEKNGMTVDYLGPDLF